MNPNECYGDEDEISFENWNNYNDKCEYDAESAYDDRD